MYYGIGVNNCHSIRRLWPLLAALFFSVNVMGRSVYDFSVESRTGQPVALSCYEGQVLLIVNTATRCGFTPQYEELESLYKDLHASGFEILDFPCNQFGNQAPGTDEEIHQFCTLTYGTEFPQFHKVEVNGPDEHPLFAFLKARKPFEGFDLNHPIGKLLDEMLFKADSHYAEKSDIKWNFTKFLVDRKGNVVARFEPTAAMTDVEEAVRRLL